MITKTAQDLFDKEASLFSWTKFPGAVKRIFIKQAPKVKDNTKSIGRVFASGAKKLSDGVVNSLDWVADKAVNQPAKTLPLLIGAGVGAKTFLNNIGPNEARIEDPHSGVTSISPFLGKVKFTNPAYEQYYNNN